MSFDFSSLITDRTQADVNNKTNKGFYGPNDLNRVDAAVEYIVELLLKEGYVVPVKIKKDWQESDYPNRTELESYRQNIVALRDTIAVMKSTPPTPESMIGLDYIGANTIEQILVDIDFLIPKMKQSNFFSGDLYSAEI